MPFNKNSNENKKQTRVGLPLIKEKDQFAKLLYFISVISN